MADFSDDVGLPEKTGSIPRTVEVARLTY